MIEQVFWLLSAIVCRWSEETTRRRAQKLGAFWFRVLRYRRGVIEANLERAFPELSAEERKTLGQAACTHLVLSLFELLRVPRYVPQLGELVRFEGLENYENARKQGRGVLCVTGHLGSFELVAGAIATALGGTVWLVVKNFPPGFDRFLTKIREGSSLKLLRASSNVLGDIFAALKRGESVVFVLDQNSTRKLGVFVDFFGHPACTMSGLATVALRSKAPVIGASIWREDQQHVLEVSPQIEAEEGASMKDTIQKNTQRYTQFLEAQIRRHPEQWLWTHKRWRTRPLNTDRSSAAVERSEPSAPTREGSSREP